MVRLLARQTEQHVDARDSQASLSCFRMVDGISSNSNNSITSSNDSSNSNNNTSNNIKNTSNNDASIKKASWQQHGAETQKQVQ